MDEWQSSSFDPPNNRPAADDLPHEVTPANTANEVTSVGFGWVKDIIQLILIVVVVRVGMDTFLPRYVVDGASMQPNFHTSERLIVDRVSLLLDGPARGDVVVLNSPRADELLLKRVIGLPNEIVRIDGGRVYIDGRLLEEDYVAEFCTYTACNGTWTLGADQYFVLGDNRAHSLDSHTFGPVARDSLKGVVRLRYWPPTVIDLLTAPSY